MIKAITFDLDMTLIDFISYKRKATSAAASAMIKAGFRGNRKKLRKELFDFYLSYGIESDDPFGKFLRKHKSYSERTLAAAINAYLKSKYSNLKPYPKVKQTLKRLKQKGYKLAIVTDAPKLKAYIRLDEMGIADLFDVVVGLEDTGRHKPSKLPFKKALKDLGVKPCDAMHVGDWREKDLKLISLEQPPHTERIRKTIFWLKVIAVSLWRLIFGSRSQYPEILILEYGADRPRDIKYLLEIVRPNISIITAIGDIPVHVEFFAGPEDVAREKARLIEQLPAAGFAILNYDDKTVMDLKEKTRAHVMTFGFGKGAEVRITNFENKTENGLTLLTTGGLARLRHASHLPATASRVLQAGGGAGRPVGVFFKLEYGSNFVPVRIDGAFGKTQGYASGVAGAVGVIFGLNLVKISEALRDYEPPPSRMQLLVGIKNTYVIDDSYNASPLSMHAALDTLKSLPGKRKIAVLGDMLEIGKYAIEAHEYMGRLAGKFVDVLITVGPRAKFIAESAREAGIKKNNIYSFDVVDEALKPTQNLIKKGDLILVKGSRAMRLDKVVEEIKAF